MAVQTINIGNIANDGTGDDLRVAFLKVNNNFTDLDSRVSAQVDGENTGSGEGIFYVKDNNNLQFKSLVAGDNVTLASSATEITINAPDPIKTIQFNANTGNLVVSSSTSLTLAGGQNISTSVSGSNINFDIDGANLVQQDTSPSLGGTLDANNNSIDNANTVTASSFVGDLTGLVYGHDVRYYFERIYKYIAATDYGEIDKNLTTGLDFLFSLTTIDYGSFTAPADISSDYGTITSPL